MESDAVAYRTSVTCTQQFSNSIKKPMIRAIEVYPLQGKDGRELEPAEYDCDYFLSTLVRAPRRWLKRTHEPQQPAKC